MKGVIRFLSGLVLVVSIIVLSACGKMHSGTDTGNSLENNTSILTEEKGKEEVIAEQPEPDLETESPWDYYSVNDKNELVLIRREIEDVRPKENI